MATRVVWFYSRKIDRHRCHSAPFSTLNIHWPEYFSGGGPDHAVQPNRFGGTDFCADQCSPCSYCDASRALGTSFTEYDLKRFARSAHDRFGGVRRREIEPAVAVAN